MEDLDKTSHRVKVNAVVLATVFGLVLLSTLSSHAFEFDPPVIIGSTEAFLDRLLDKFPLPTDYPAPFEEARLIQTYDLPAPVFDGTDHLLSYRADVYDSALAAIEYIELGRLDRAKQLVDGLLLVQALDPYHDGRIRTSYYANDLLDPTNAMPSIDDPSAAVGNMAWAGIALTRFYQVAQQQQFLAPAGRREYLNAAKMAGDWINDNTRQDDVFGGFSMGFDGSNNPIAGTVHARTTEHNIDIFAFANQLYRVDRDPSTGAGNSTWLGMMNHARTFAHKMFDASADRKYWTGTKASDADPNRIAINFFPVPADGQSWSFLAQIDARNNNATGALDWVLEHLTDCPPDNVTTRCGVRFSNNGDHAQAEPTAGMAMALWFDDNKDDAQTLFNYLEWLRTVSPGRDPNGVGILATDKTPESTTGFGGDTRLHELYSAGTAWTALALMAHQCERDANPLLPIGLGDMDFDTDVDFDDIDDFQEGLMNPESYHDTYHVPPSVRGDMDHDGDHDFDDIPGFVALLRGNCFRAVPEPWTLLLAAVALFGLAARAGLSRKP